MSKVISVLEKMASDAAMNDDSVVAELVATCDINDGQMQAIMANDVEALVESTQDLPVIKSVVPIIPAEDDEDDEDAETNNKKSANISAIACNY